MNRGKVWVVAIFLTALATIAVSCASAPAASPTSAAPAATKATETAPTASAPAAAASPNASTTPSQSAGEAPKYGGVLNVTTPNSPPGFDQGPGAVFAEQPTMFLTNDELWIGDWSKGLAGTGEVTYMYGGDIRYPYKTGNLAESWKIVAPGHWVFKIRQGVHFALNKNSAASRLVNGREVTADDVVYSIERVLKENAYTRASQPEMVKNMKVTAPDKYTLDMQFAPGDTSNVANYVIGMVDVIPREVIDKYGDMRDWHNSVGSGPFMMTNYVSGSEIAFAKNPGYWMKDPVGPGKGNLLPYVDGLNILILPDPSTQQTALRTGKIDMLGPGLTKDDFDQLNKTTPQLKSRRYLAEGDNLFYMRLDKKNLPFDDKRVRQALTMAIDYKTIVSKLMQGDGEYPGFPTMSAPDFKSVYFPLSQAPEIVQEMFSYNPTKAKQLLAQAGYPNGFKTEVVVDATGGISSDQVSAVKNYWSQIGVDAAINPLEFGVFNRMRAARSYPEMLYTSSGGYGIYIRNLNFDSGSWGNGSHVDDPTAKKTTAEMNAAMAAGDEAKADAAYKTFEKYAMEQAWMVPYPRPYNYVVWWPWLKNYHGENTLVQTGAFSWSRFVWIDQGSKKSMGY